VRSADVVQQGAPRFQRTGVVTGEADAGHAAGESRPGSYTHYPPEPSSPRDARATVRTFCADHSMPHLVDDAALIVSELVTNACRVAVGPVTMALVDDDGTLLAVVGDDSCEALPAAVQDNGQLLETGRGLFVLDQLAGTWGTSATAGGKNVWFRLP
jgi:anti-sigma regulatory factor (Ser/Thr protein kinase)